MHVVLIAAFAVLGGQQPPPPTLNFDALKTTVAQGAVRANQLQELTVDWSAFSGAPGTLVSASATVPVNSFDIRSRRIVPGPMPIDRNPELSADQLVVVGTDAAGRTLSWQLIKDPRIVRSEGPGPGGVLTGQVLYRTDVNVIFVLPDLPQLTEARIYQPQWTGSNWTLNLVASLAVATAR